MRTDRGRVRITLFEVLCILVVAIVLQALVVYARQAHGAESPVVHLSQRDAFGWIHASGTVIGRIDGESVAVATCAHGWRVSDVVCVQIGGACRASRFVAHRYDQSADVALVRVPLLAAHHLPCCQIGSPPAVGTQVRRIGFPGDLPRNSAGVLTSTSGWWMWSTGAALQGESGGAVLASGADGESRLVGVIKGTTRDAQVATSAEVVHDLAMKAWGRLPSCGRAPVVPEEVAPPPPLDEPPRLQPVPDPRFAAFEARLAALEARQPVPGPQGPPGVVGPQGPPGPQGPIGPGGDASGLKARLEKLEATRIPVQILDETGKIVDEESVPLGQPIRLRILHRVKTKSADAR